MTKIAKTPFSAKEKCFDSANQAGGREKIKSLLKLLKSISKKRFSSLGIAAVILFSLIFLLMGSELKASTFFKKEIKDQVLISEDLLRAQFQVAEEKLIKEGSYLYSANYGFLNSDNETDEGFGGQEDLNNNILVQNNAFLSPSIPINELQNISSFNRHRSGVVTYKVQSGDTPSYIAASFGISTNTVLWANNLSYWGLIKPGDELTILPVSGILHKVKKGETLAGIVKKYKGDVDKTIAFNGLPADNSIRPDQEIIIPDGKKSIYYYPRPTVQFTSYYSGPYSGKSHRFPWGQCTWYVAQKRYVPWSGNAKNWLTNAQRYGFQISSEPTPGAIMVTREGWYGHVAYVEAVSGDYVTISEMSMGHGVRHIRTLNKNSRLIRGYIN